MKYLSLILCYCSILALLLPISMGTSESAPKISSVSPQPCSEPLTWQIGRVDSRFDITRETVKRIMAEINTLWSNAVGQELMTYSDSGQVALNFIYSKQQEITNSEYELSNHIDRMKLQHYTLEQEYEQLFNEHHAKLGDYNRIRSEYIDKVEKYNEGVSRRSDSGVIPREENEQLLKLKKNIEILERELSQIQIELNSGVQRLEQRSTQMDHMANRVNELIFSYKDQFGLERTFYQGVYIDDLNHKKINIYEFENIDRLKLVLAHEVGHALGVGHLKNPKSIMYYMMEKQNEKNVQLSEEDRQAIKDRCGK